ncbi:MAG: hypothetical protein RLZZ11_1935 [Cyanobacteriota bacterium]
MNQLDLWWQELVDAMAQQRVGLAAAHLHQRPRPADGAANPLQKFLGLAHG